MIDWSDLGRKRNGLFAAVCFRKRGLPLLSWATTVDELNPSQNRLEEAFIAPLLRNLPDTFRPLLADRGFGRASLLRWLPEMLRHTGRTVDYVVRLKGNVHIQTADGYQGLLRKYPLPSGRYVFLLGVRYRSDGAATVNLALYWGRGHREPWHLASGNIAARCQGGGAALSPADAAGAVLSQWQAVFRLGSWNGNHYGAAGAYAGGAVISLLFAAAGGAAGVVAVPAAGLFVGEAGWDCCGWAWSNIRLRRSHRPDGSACLTPESGYARVPARYCCRPGPFIRLTLPYQSTRFRRSAATALLPFRLRRRIQSAA